MSACNDGKPGSSVGYQAGSNSCSDQIQTDFQSIGNDLGVNPNLSGLKNAKTRLQEFKTKYAGVVCKDKDGSMVNVGEATDGIIGQIDSAISKMESNPASGTITAPPMPQMPATDTAIPNMPNMPNMPVMPNMPAMPSAGHDVNPVSQILNCSLQESNGTLLTADVSHISGVSAEGTDYVIQVSETKNGEKVSIFNGFVSSEAQIATLANGKKKYCGNEKSSGTIFQLNESTGTLTYVRGFSDTEDCKSVNNALYNASKAHDQSLVSKKLTCLSASR